MKQEQAPLLTIAIPTYNRSYCLGKVLKSVTGQVGNDPLVEIIILDNASTDDTEVVSQKYQEKFDNVSYRRNAENIGGDANVRLAYKSSHGKYVICLGDDDYYVKPVLYKVLNYLCTGEEPAIIAMKRDASKSYEVYQGKGIDDYLMHISHQSTFISILVMRRDLIIKAMEDDRFNDTSLPQLYFTGKMLLEEPKFAILTGNILEGTSGEGTLAMGIDVSNNKVGFAKIFVQQYFDILKVFLTNGLTEKTLINEKIRVLNELILPHYAVMKKGMLRTYRIDENALEIYDKYYGDIEGYMNGRKRIQQLLE